MVPKLLALHFLAIIGLAKAATMPTSVNLTSTGCVDVGGFETCQNVVASSTAACIAEANAADSELAALACGCVYYILNYNCYAAHCWNRVYECEYQEYIVQSLIQCPNKPLSIPYFPAPNNAPDACSCNLGNVFLAINGSIGQDDTCLNNISSTIFTDPTSSVQKTQGCNCCAISAATSSIYGLCPNTDPSLIGLSTITSFASGVGASFSNCAEPLSEFNCESDLGFPPVAGGTFFGPNDLPASGTATLSNVAGTVTAPASGSVFTYTNGGDKQVYTISAADVKAVNGNGVGGGSGSGPTATNSPNTSLGEKIVLSRGLLLLALISCFAALLL